MTSDDQNHPFLPSGGAPPTANTTRDYWLPVAMHATLEEHPVIAVRVMDEDLTLYRDTSGDLGLIGAHCAHRRVNLSEGIREPHGLRCPMHGWYYNADGRCLEMPLEPSNTSLNNTKIAGYPVTELGGVIFAYLGILPAPAIPSWTAKLTPTALDINQFQQLFGETLHLVTDVDKSVAQ